MRPLTYYIGTSLDGYIAGPEGQVDFYPVSDDHLEQMVSAHPEVLPTHMRQQLGIDDRPNRRFDTVMMGRGTYEPRSPSASPIPTPTCALTSSRPATTSRGGIRRCRCPMIRSA